MERKQSKHTNRIVKRNGLYYVYAALDGGKLSYRTDTKADAERFLADASAIAKFVRPKAEKHPGGRPVGPKMPCGWCGRPMTAREIREHFTTCPRRPKQ